MKWKWLLRIASLLIVLGFFMPAVLVSCNSELSDLTGLDASQSMSLVDIADFADQPILYLIPVLAIVAVILSFLQDASRSRAIGFLWAQLVIIILQLLILIITIVTIRQNARNYTLDTVTVTPIFGTFIIVGAGVLYLLSWLYQKNLISSSPPINGPSNERQDFQPIDYLPPPPAPPLYQPISVEDNAGQQVPSQPYLVLISGNFPIRNVQISNDNFSIGRASTNQVHLTDSSVSRIHAVFRYSQNMWFLQDQESSGGTYVNGVRIDAVKLGDNDEIGIGPYRFRFQLPRVRRSGQIS